MTRSPRALLLLVAIAAMIALSAACGGGGGGASSDEGTDAIIDSKAKSEGLPPPPTMATTIDLRGLDAGVDLEGACFSRYVVLWVGRSGNVDRYLLSFHVKSNTDNESELFKFLGDKKCGSQQGEVFNHVLKTLAIPEGSADNPPPLDISFRTGSGARFFL